MTDTLPEITVQELADWRRDGHAFSVLDVREAWEIEICSLAGALTIPLSSLPQHLGDIPAEGALVVLCHHGMRSRQAVAWLHRAGRENAVNLAGGIDAWARQVEPSMEVY